MLWRESCLFCVGARGLVVQFGRCIVRWRKNLLIFNRKTAKIGRETGTLYVDRKTCLILTQKCQNFVSKCKFFIPTNKRASKQLILACFGLVSGRKFPIRTILKKHNTNPRKIQEFSLHILILVFKSIHHSQINISMLLEN